MVINNINKINNFEWNSETVLALRDHIGNSQTKLANELGVRQQTISEWEQGQYKPRGASITLLNLLGRTAGFPFQKYPKKKSQLSFERFGFESAKSEDEKNIIKSNLASRQKIKRLNSIDEFEKRNNEIPI
ncbi:MAG: helix-turn-helix domain-containing protein [Dehalococcoidia bacterium]|nr:helix-turn-helix domain-containing protein [Dehalococcoidia bacterium]